MKQISKLYLLVAVFSVFISCNEKKKQGRNFIIPIDFSSSRDSSAIEWYRQTVATYIIGKAKPEDRVIVLPIDNNSESWGQEIFRVDLNMFQYGNEYSGLQKEKIKQSNLKDTLVSKIEQFNRAFNLAKQQRSAYSEGTDILGALKLCRKYLSSEYRNIIVLLSDMRQFTPKGAINLEGIIWSRAMVDTSLAHAESIPLDNCQVIVLTGPQSNITRAQYEMVEHFWKEYFKSCNAQLLDYSSAAVSKIEEITATK